MSRRNRWTDRFFNTRRSITRGRLVRSHGRTKRLNKKAAHLLACLFNHIAEDFGLTQGNSGGWKW